MAEELRGDKQSKTMNKLHFGSAVHAPVQLVSFGLPGYGFVSNQPLYLTVSISEFYGYSHERKNYKFLL